MRSSSGMPSVATMLPSAWVTRTSSAWPPLVKPPLTQADVMPTAQWAQVLSLWQNGTTTNWPGRKDVTSLPTASTTPTSSWPIGLPASTSLAPR